MSPAFALVLVVAFATYALRALPLALFRRPLREPHAVAFVEYLPYGILAALVVPGVFEIDGLSQAASWAGALVALVLALLRLSLPVVAAAATLAAWAFQSIP